MFTNYHVNVVYLSFISLSLCLLSSTHTRWEKRKIEFKNVKRNVCKCNWNREKRKRTKNVIVMCRRRNYYIYRLFVIINFVCCDMAAHVNTQTHGKQMLMHNAYYLNFEVFVVGFICVCSFFFSCSGNVRLTAISICFELELVERNENFWFWFSNSSQTC